MKKQNLLKKGFSLIELSIVILVIGILVLGITKGTAIMAKTRLSSARSLTAGSPVPLVSDLVAWYEPTLTSSFNTSDQFNGNALTYNGTTSPASWYDNSPNKSEHATTVNGTAPTYRETSINNLPGVRFGGAGSLSFNSISMNQKYYTIFVVENRGAATGDFLSIGGTGSDSANTMGYKTTGTIGSGENGNGAASVTNFTTAYSTPRIITFLSDAASKRVFVNGTVGGTTGTAGLLSATSAGLIGNSTTAYTGEISEIIIYNKNLKAEERNDIQAYLSKKYGIKVTTSS